MNTIKLNTDGSFIQASFLCGFGGIIRDSKGHWIVGFYGASPSLSPIHAELLALKACLQIAKGQWLTNLEVEMDSTNAINCLTNGMPIFDNIILECKLLMNQLKVQVINHTFREANKLAHKMGKRALSDNKCRDLTILHTRLILQLKS